MILIYGECNKNASGVAPLCRQNLRFFPISFNQANDVYVKIYEIARVTIFYVFFFFNQKQISALSLEMYCG
jgi:hypothetical protein